MKKSLYNIQQDYLKVVEEIIDQEGEITEEQEKSFEITIEELHGKATNYSLIALKNDYHIEEISREILRLGKLKNRYEKINEKIKSSVLHAMENCNVGIIESQHIRVSIRQSEYIEIENEVSLPEECFTIHPEERVPNKKKIKELIESGYPLQGASILKRNNLQIK